MDLPNHEVNSAKEEEDYFSFTGNLPPLDYVPKHNQYLLPVDEFANVSGIDDRFNLHNPEIISMVQSYYFQNQNQNQNQPVMITYTGDENGNGGGSSYTSKMRLSRDNISKYFYMPLSQAANELNVGSTLLKKRCRELGIHRWPHRKLMSLQVLINNVQQELGTESGERAKEKLEETMFILEEERKKMEEIPDLQLEHNTHRLRQACYKAKYKKNKYG